MRTVIFDLDGTLVQTEKLKAHSYAMAVQKIRGLPEPDSRAVEGYREIVGATREIASQHIMEELDLEADYGTSEPWDVLTAMRLAIYNNMVADPKVLRDNQWPHTTGLLRVAKETYCHTGLATMSARTEALHVLRSLDLETSLDLILAREDVQNPKPDPEIYLLAARTLEVPVEKCLVLEDSPTRVRAGLAAGMNVIAIATPFTTAGLHDSHVLESTWIIHDPSELPEVVKKRVEKHNRTAHPNSGV